MMKIFDVIRIEKKIKENLGNQDQNNQNQDQDQPNELECEERIIQDKQRFGRVRTSLMRELRQIYGVRTANRAMWRVNARKIMK